MDRAPAPPPRYARAAAWLALAAVAGIALAAQAWMVAQPFQLDDHLMLLDPAGVFHSASRFAERAVGTPEPTMLRWTLWSAWIAVAGVSGEPLSPPLFHAFGLALHVACCALVAACATRLFGAHVSPHRPWLPGLVAGVGMAVSAGAIEAVSWASAWGDAFALLFACAALLALLRADDARAEIVERGRSRAAWLAVGGACALLSLLSKESAIALPCVLAIALATRARLAGRAFPRAECTVLAAALALFLLLRVLVLGGLHLSSGSATPNAYELAQRAPAVLRGFVQALHPHNAAPEFADLAPRVVRWHLDVPIFLAWGMPVAVACFASRRGLRTGALALAALALLLAPTALIATGARTNVLSRAEYAPLALAWLLWGAALVRLWNLGGARANGLRWLAAACAAVQLAAALDLRAHVVATQQLAAEQIAALDRCVEDARAEHARTGQRLPLTIVAIAGEPGLGGIPLVGAHARYRYAPPFAAADARTSDFDVRAWGTRAECEREWPTAELATRDLVWLDASGDVLALRARGAPASELRAAALPRARAPLAQGFAPARRSSLAFRSEPAPQSSPRPEPTSPPAPELRYVPSALLPAHAFGALELAFAPGPAVELELVLESGKQRTRHAFALRASEQELRRVALAPAPSLARLFGPPIHAFAIAAPQLPALVYEPKLLDQPPLVELLEPSAQSALVLDPTRAPHVALARAPANGIELELRLELALQLPIGRVGIAATAPVSALDASTLRAELRAFRFDAWPAEVLSLPWRDFCAGLLEPELARRGRDHIAGSARLVIAVRGSDLVAGVSEWREVVLRR
ncbi:MAG: hypothetical protein EPO68_09800 [Planctomycetota bacterium]|nr:MAG: hypothetical protein EPO68_09800 [Planctomycetota bacterium]